MGELIGRLLAWLFRRSFRAELQHEVRAQANGRARHLRWKQGNRAFWREIADRQAPTPAKPKGRSHPKKRFRKCAGVGVAVGKGGGKRAKDGC